MNAGAAVVLAAFTSAFARREVLGVSEWADAHAVFVREGVGATRWSTARVPYLREVMDSAADPSVRQVTLKKAEQLGGTEAVQRIVQEVVDQRPRPVLYIYPNEKVAAKQARLRLLPSLRATPATNARLGPSRVKASSLLLRLDRMSVMLAGSNSPANVEGVAAGVTIVAELARCESSTLARVRGRGSAYHDPVLVVLGTPGEAGAGIDAEFLASDRRRYHVPCPACGVYHVRRVEDLRWPGARKDGAHDDLSRDFSASPEDAERFACMVCPCCGAVIAHDANMWQLGRGVWVPEGCSVDPLTCGFDRREVSAAVRGVPRVRSHRGYELTGLYRSLPEGVNPYGVVARDLLAANGNPDSEWWNRRMGLAWAPKGEGVDLASVRAACVAAADGGYAYGTCPAWAVALVAGVDVQHNSAFVEVLALSAGDIEGGQRCGLVWCQEVPCPVGLGLGPVEAALRRAFPRPLPAGAAGGAAMTVGGVAMDSGHRPDEVYQWASRGGLRRAVKGLGGASGRGGMAQMVRWSTVHSPTGDVQLLLVNTWAFKAQAVAQLQNAGARPARVDLGGAMRIELPHGAPTEWLVQVTSEHLVRLRRGGVVRQAWVLKAGRSANHYLDCHVYALAYCYAMGAASLRSGAVRSAGPKVSPGALIR